MMDHQGGQRAQSSKRRIIFVGVILLMVCVVVAVAVPVAEAKRGSNGEHEDDIEAMLEPKAGFDSKTQLSVTLDDLHSSTSSNSTDDLSDDALEDGPLSMNGTVASNHTFTNATQNISRDITQDSSNADTEESIMIQPLPPPGLAVIVDSFTVLATISHDSQAFTQGLTFDPLDSSVVYESTGLYGRSSVRKVDITTGEVLLKTDTSREMFGEGLAYYTTKTTPAEGRLIHITWQSQRGFIFDAETLTVLEEFRFETERNQGWGITYNPIADQFLVTDGSSMLHFGIVISTRCTYSSHPPIG
ncbi:Glutamine cyclotransferase [Seminavis robusta]|uniref:Glutamine cyclotransferase n=1 Tax=Seminavis robusta TaxID=568900 RepID=A0A9N8E5H3_9STRA|nr:Glutamine cyclotransferase [Seminavis robusta]|eukprot:Sro569_g168290.1 Glutamine cyclotransferase (302) ;mRNA; f:15601-16506